MACSPARSTAPASPRPRSPPRPHHSRFPQPRSRRLPRHRPSRCRTRGVSLCNCRRPRSRPTTRSVRTTAEAPWPRAQAASSRSRSGPTTTGDQTGNLYIPSNLTASPLVVPLDGPGQSAAALTVSPTSLTFPSTPQGSTSPSQGITLTSSGGSTVQLQTPTIAGSYQIVNSTCGATLAPTTTCTIQIVFAPTTIGSSAGLLTVPANVSGGKVTAALNGTGVAPSAPRAYTQLGHVSLYHRGHNLGCADSHADQQRRKRRATPVAHHHWRLCHRCQHLWRLRGRGRKLQNPGDI